VLAVADAHCCAVAAVKQDIVIQKLLGTSIEMKFTNSEWRCDGVATCRRRC
jgi:hypothetical protein